MMETRLIPKKFLKLIKNLADENRNYKKIFGNVFWLEVVKEKNYSWFNLRLNSKFTEANDDISINLFRLAAYLMATDKLMLVDLNNAGKLVASSGAKDNAIKLLMGSCTSCPDNISKKNREGLYIELGEKDDKISVLAGDVSYNSMDSSIFSKQLAFLHVPHHGSKMKLSRLLNSQWGKHAVISTKYKLGSTEVNFSHERVLNTTFNGNVHNTSEYYGDLRSIRLLKSGEVQKIISDNYIII